MSLLFALALSWTLSERVSGPSMSLYDLRTDGNAIYWLNCPVPLQSCSLERLVGTATKPEVMTNDFELGGIYTLAGDSVYMTAGGKIVQLPKSGGKRRVLAKVEGWIKDIQVAGDTIYVSTADTYMMTGRNPHPRHGTIVRFPKSGGAVRQIAETNSSDMRMVLDSRRIYFIGETSIQSVPLDGGRIETLARDDANPAMSMAADRDAIYYAAGGEVRRVPKTGGKPSVLYKAEIVLKVIVENGFVYASRNMSYGGGGITETPAIVRIPVTGGKAEVLASPEQVPEDMAVRAGEVFVVLSSPGQNVPDHLVVLRHD